MRRKYTSLPFEEFETASGNFDDNRQTIDTIIIHSTVGTVKSAISRFGNPESEVSAHYIIGNDGKLYAGLEEYLVAYHSGKYAVNQKSIGIEHEWYDGLAPSDALYQTSAKLVKDICDFYNIPIDRDHIKQHKEIVATRCPNAIDIDRIIKEAQVDPLAQCAKDRDANWRIVNTVGDALDMSPDPNDKKATSEMFSKAILDLKKQLKECQNSQPQSPTNPIAKKGF